MENQKTISQPYQVFRTGSISPGPEYYNGPIKITSSTPKKLSDCIIITVNGSGFDYLRDAIIRFTAKAYNDVWFSIGEKLTYNDESNNVTIISGQIKFNTQFVNNNEFIYTLSNNRLQAIYSDPQLNGLNFYITLEYTLSGRNYETEFNSNAMYLIDY